jgi:hypothetical protein
MHSVIWCATGAQCFVLHEHEADAAHGLLADHHGQ